MENNKYKSFIMCTADPLRDAVQYAIEKRKEENGEFYLGYLTAFHRIVTLLQQQAEIWEIPLVEIGLDKIKDTDLM